MVATCLPRSTIRDFTRGSVEPKPETLSRGLKFLDPENSDTTAGWRELLAPETLANVLGVDVRTASDLFHGKRRWHEEERARLAVYKTGPESPGFQAGDEWPPLTNSHALKYSASELCSRPGASWREVRPLEAPGFSRGRCHSALSGGELSLGSSRRHTELMQ